MFVYLILIFFFNFIELRTVIAIEQSPAQNTPVFALDEVSPHFWVEESPENDAKELFGLESLEFDEPNIEIESHTSLPFAHHDMPSFKSITRRVEESTITLTLNFNQDIGGIDWEK